MNIQEEIVNVVFEIAKKPLVEIIYDNDLHLVKDLNYDSLMFIELIVTIEEKFGIEFEFEALDLEKIYNLRSFIEIVEQSIKEKK